MEQLNEWLLRWEPLWLFLVLAAEGLIGLYSGVILTIEYFYDAQVEEKKHKRRNTKNKVEVVVDKNGHASVISAPKGLDINITSEGQ